MCDHVALNEHGLRRAACASRKRIRQEREDQPGNYASLQILDIPQNLLHDRGANLLLADSGPGDDRILAFGSRRHLTFLHQEDVVLADGTFRVTPQLWKKRCTLHVTIQGFSIPVLNFLVLGKNTTLLRMVTDMVPDAGVKNWLFDFAASMSHAHQDVLPHFVASGFFHLSDYASQNGVPWGRRQHCLDNSEFRCRVMVLRTLAFLPLAHVEKAFDMLKLQFRQSEQAMREHFKCTCIGTDRATSTQQHLSRPPIETFIPDVNWGSRPQPMRVRGSTTSSNNVTTKRLIPQFPLSSGTCTARLWWQTCTTPRHPGGTIVYLRKPLLRKMERYAAMLVRLQDTNIMHVLTQLTNVRFTTNVVFTTGAWRSIPAPLGCALAHTRARWQRVVNPVLMQARTMKLQRLQIYHQEQVDEQIVPAASAQLLVQDEEMGHQEHMVEPILTEPTKPSAKRALVCVTCGGMDLSGQPMVARASGGAQRRKLRRLRAALRHEQQSIAMALASALHHSADKTTRAQHRAPRGQMNAGTEYYELSDEDVVPARGSRPPCLG